jgi:hypothetical protein
METNEAEYEGHDGVIATNEFSRDAHLLSKSHMFLWNPLCPPW